jgi:hypothetical protein
MELGIVIHMGRQYIYILYIYVFREWLTTRCPYDLSKILSVVSFGMVMAN